ncbi:MAG: hypothetical protein V4490_02495 [Pseudomonadota bacterium]
MQSTDLAPVSTTENQNPLQIFINEFLLRNRIAFPSRKTIHIFDFSQFTDRENLSAKYLSFLEFLDNEPDCEKFNQHPILRTVTNLTEFLKWLDVGEPHPDQSLLAQIKIKVAADIIASLIRLSTDFYKIAKNISLDFNFDQAAKESIVFQSLLQCYNSELEQNATPDQFSRALSEVCSVASSVSSTLVWHAAMTRSVHVYFSCEAQRIHSIADETQRIKELAVFASFYYNLNRTSRNAFVNPTLVFPKESELAIVIEQDETLSVNAKLCFHFNQYIVDQPIFHHFSAPGEVRSIYEITIDLIKLNATAQVSEDQFNSSEYDFYRSLQTLSESSPSFKNMLKAAPDTNSALHSRTATRQVQEFLTTNTPETPQVNERINALFFSEPAHLHYLNATFIGLYIKDHPDWQTTRNTLSSYRNLLLAETSLIQCIKALVEIRTQAREKIESEQTDFWTRNSRPVLDHATIIYNKIQTDFCYLIEHYTSETRLNPKKARLVIMKSFQHTVLNLYLLAQNSMERTDSYLSSESYLYAGDSFRLFFESLASSITLFVLNRKMNLVKEIVILIRLFPHCDTPSPNKKMMDAMQESARSLANRELQHWLTIPIETLIGATEHTQYKEIFSGTYVQFLDKLQACIPQNLKVDTFNGLLAETYNAIMLRRYAPANCMVHVGRLEESGKLLTLQGQAQIALTNNFNDLWYSETLLPPELRSEHFFRTSFAEESSEFEDYCTPKPADQKTISELFRTHNKHYTSIFVTNVRAGVFNTVAHQYSLKVFNSNHRTVCQAFHDFSDRATTVQHDNREFCIKAYYHIFAILSHIEDFKSHIDIIVKKIPTRKTSVEQAKKDSTYVKEEFSSRFSDNFLYGFSQYLASTRTWLTKLDSNDPYRKKYTLFELIISHQNFAKFGNYSITQYCFTFVREFLSSIIEDKLKKHYELYHPSGAVADTALEASTQPRETINTGTIAAAAAAAAAPEPAADAPSRPPVMDVDSVKDDVHPSLADPTALQTTDSTVSLEKAAAPILLASSPTIAPPENINLVTHSMPPEADIPTATTSKVTEPTPQPLEIITPSQDPGATALEEEAAQILARRKSEQATHKLAQDKLDAQKRAERNKRKAQNRADRADRNVHKSEPEKPIVAMSPDAVIAANPSTAVAKKTAPNPSLPAKVLPLPVKTSATPASPVKVGNQPSEIKAPPPVLFRVPAPSVVAPGKGNASPPSFTDFPPLPSKPLPAPVNPVVVSTTIAAAVIPREATPNTVAASSLMATGAIESSAASEQPQGKEALSGMAKPANGSPTEDATAPTPTQTPPIDGTPTRAAGRQPHHPPSARRPGNPRHRHAAQPYGHGTQQAMPAPYFSAGLPVPDQTAYFYPQPAPLFALMSVQSLNGEVIPAFVPVKPLYPHAACDEYGNPIYNQIPGPY